MRIEDWMFVDLDIAREAGVFDKKRREIQNKDGTTKFVAIPLIELADVGALVEVSTSLEHLTERKPLFEHPVIRNSLLHLSRHERVEDLLRYGFTHEQIHEARVRAGYEVEP